MFKKLVVWSSGLPSYLMMAYLPYLSMTIFFSCYGDGNLVRMVFIQNGSHLAMKTLKDFLVWSY